MPLFVSVAVIVWLPKVSRGAVALDDEGDAVRRAGHRPSLVGEMRVEAGETELAVGEGAARLAEIAVG
jgi:hypothetical protein